MSVIRDTMKLYGGQGYVTAFTYLRFCHAPYRLAESVVPRAGKIVDLGCGYGYFSNLLALASPERQVVGVELNARKLQYADKGLRNVRFVNEDITNLAMDDCDCVVLVHVLHHLASYAEQERLLATIRGKLKPGGTVVNVEIDYRPAWKFLFTTLIDNSLYFGDRFYFRSAKDWCAAFERLGYTVEKVLRADRRVPLSHKIFVARK